MKELIGRVESIIDYCWLNFSAKVGGGLIDVNKEASMQLNFAYMLKNSIDLVIHHQDELVSIELETSIPTNGRLRECDIVIRIQKDKKTLFIPIEMKCYKTISSSGGLRGAQDLFRFGVYDDLQLLESYENENYSNGIQLTMTDNRNLVFPKSKAGKSWAYDISNSTVINDEIEINVPIGGKSAKVALKKNYAFNWQNIGDYYFLKLKGI